MNGVPRIVMTGAASGIGAAAAAELRSRGARVVGLDLESDDQADIACDIRDPAGDRRGATRAASPRAGT